MRLKGRVVHVGQNAVWLARGSRLLKSEDQGATWQAIGRLPLGTAEQLAFATSLGRRLTRAGVHHCLPHQGIVLAGQHLYVHQSDDYDRPFRRAAPLEGTRPLSVATDGTLTCYGEYRGNPERSPVHVWATWDRGSNWEPIHEFGSVRHVHGVHFDEYTDSFWVTTGDEDHESAIWVTGDRFETISQVAGGSQQLRVIQLLFSDQYVYFGSDTPRAPNHLYRLDRDTARIERLQSVGSSVFYGWKTGGHLFFSTAGEPSRVNRTKRAEIWHSADGEQWSLVEALPSDIWPSRLFQYGQVLFPSGPGDGERLYYTPQGVQGDGHTLVVLLSDLQGKSEGTQRS